MNKQVGYLIKFWNCALVIFGVLLLLISSCKKDVDKDDENYIFTGTIIDQVTRKPVPGATVCYGYRLFCDRDRSVTQAGQCVLSDVDGNYKISVSPIIWDNRDYCYVIYARMDGYIGSDLVSKGGQIALYHPAELHLHVINDTINNEIDSTNVYIIGSEKFWTYPGFIGILMDPISLPTFRKICSGREFDTVFVVNRLWGNCEYRIAGGISYSPGPHLFDYKLTLVPDSIIHFDVSF